jgi:hypothetical protein
MPTKRPTVKQLQQALDITTDALQAALSVRETDSNFFTGGLSPLYDGRLNWDRKKIFAESLRAWRVNPIARRIVKLMTSFAIGKGLTIKSEDPAAQAFLDEWTQHPLNDFRRNVKRWKDEDTRTGNLFFLFSVDGAGMSYVRAVPAEMVDEIQTAENDVEQETGYVRQQLPQDTWPAYKPGEAQTSFMVHFASNQPVGSPWGEADLSPLLVWIGRYADWLENRARLNKYRTAFMYVIRGSYNSETERALREATINANPPKPGSVLVTNANAGEDWGVLSGQLDSFDASMDGEAIKKMILDGIGHPMHWHAEPEGGARTTAEAAGTPTFRTLEEMQVEFFMVIERLALIALQVRGIKTTAPLQVTGPDITERDNATLALALGRSYPQLADLYDREGIEPAEFLRLVYATFAETWEGKAPTIKRKPLIQTQPGALTDDETEPTDPDEEKANAGQVPEWSANNAGRRTSHMTINMPEQRHAVTVNLPAAAPPEVMVNVAPPEVNVQVDAPAIDINSLSQGLAEAQAPIIVQVNPTPVTIQNDVQPAAVTVRNQVTPAAVTIENKIPTIEETHVVERDSEGRATRIKKTARQ